MQEEALIDRIREEQKKQFYNNEKEDYEDQKNIENNIVHSYNDSEYNEKNNINYRKYTSKDYFSYRMKKIGIKMRNIAIIVFIFVFIFGILWIIPHTKQWMINLYKENIFVKLIVDIFKVFFTVIAKTFEGVFNFDKGI